jgi:hypothetical protein
MSITLLDGDMPTLTVEAALSAATDIYGVWDTGVWDTAAWGPDIAWTDISRWARTVTSSRKFTREVAAWEAGTCTIVLDNAKAQFSPTNLAGPFVTSGITQIRPWRPVRWKATWAGVTYYGYTGYALAWEQAWAGGHADSIVTVSATDELSKLAKFDGLELPSQGAGETSGQRIHRVLNNAGHTGPRNIDVGRVTMEATTLAQNAVTELKLVTDSEGGGLWVEADGTVTFENEFALLENARSNTVQAVFSDGSTPRDGSSGGELPCANITAEYNGDLIKNIISYARAGSTSQVVVDNTSRALYGDFRDTRTDLVCADDAQVLNLATFALARYKDPELRVVQIEIKPRSNPTRLFPQVLGRRVRDLVRVIIRPIGGETIIRDCHIAGIEHTITGDDWITKFDLWSATPYLLYSGSRWDVGLFDSAAWFF